MKRAWPIRVQVVHKLNGVLAEGGWISADGTSAKLEVMGGAIRSAMVVSVNGTSVGYAYPTHVVDLFGISTKLRKRCSNLEDAKTFSEPLHENTKLQQTKIYCCTTWDRRWSRGLCWVFTNLIQRQLQ